MNSMTSYDYIKQATKLEDIPQEMKLTEAFEGVLARNLRTIKNEIIPFNGSSFISGSNNIIRFDLKPYGQWADFSSLYMSFSMTTTCTTAQANILLEQGAGSIIKKLTIYINDQRYEINNFNVINSILNIYNKGYTYRKYLSTVCDKLPYTISSAATTATGEQEFEVTVNGGNSAANYLCFNIDLPFFKTFIPVGYLNKCWMEIQIDDASNIIFDNAADSVIAGINYTVNDLRLHLNYINIDDDSDFKAILNKPIINNSLGITHATSYNISAASTNVNINLPQSLYARGIIICMRPTTILNTTSERTLNYYSNGLTRYYLTNKGITYPQTQSTITNNKALVQQRNMELFKKINDDENIVNDCYISSELLGTTGTYEHRNNVYMIDLEQVNEINSRINSTKLENAVLVLESTGGFTVAAQIDIFILYDTIIEYTNENNRFDIKINSMW